MSSHHLLNRFLFNISWNALGKTGSQIFLFVASIAVTRYLGGERYGLYASVLVIPAFLRLLTTFGLETVLNKKLPELAARDFAPERSRFLVRTLLVTRLASVAVAAVTAWLFLPVYFEWIGQSALTAYRDAAALYYAAATVQSFFMTLLMTRLRYRETAALDILGTSLNLALLGVFIYFDAGISGVLYAFILSTAATITVCLRLAKQDLAGPALAAEWGDSLRVAGSSYGITLFGFGLLIQSDILLMNFFAVPPERIGFYHLATSVAAMLTFVLTGAGPMALALFSESWARESATGLTRAWGQIIGFMVFCVAPLYMFMIVNGREVIAFVYGDAYAGAGQVLTLYLLFSLAGAAFGASFLSSALQVVGESKFALRATVEGSLLNILLDLVLIPAGGELGAATATGSVMVYLALRQLHRLGRHIDTAAVFPHVGGCLLLSLLALVPQLALSRLWLDHVFAALLEYAASFVLLLFIAKPLREEHLAALAGWPRGLVTVLELFVSRRE